MDNGHPVYPSFQGSFVLENLGQMDFRTQSSRNASGTASRSTAPPCSRSPASCVNSSESHTAFFWLTSRQPHMSNVMMNSAGHPNRLRHVLQFQLEKWPQGWEVQVSTLTCVFQKQMQRWEKCSFTCIIQFLSLDRFWLTFKTPQHPPQSIR